MKRFVIILIMMLASIVNAAWYGEHDIDEYLTFAVTTSQFSTGAGVDAAAVPAYSIYEDETAAEVVGPSNMAKLDDAGSIGFYTERLQLTDALFDAGKMYTIYITATVDSVAGTASHAFKMRAAPVALATALATAQTELDKIGTIPALDSGAQTIGAAIAKLADDNGGATFDAETDSLTEIRDDRTIAAADYVVVGDTIAGVTLVTTTTTNSDLVTAAAVVNEWESQSQLDPTGFHVNTMEVNGIAQTANDMSGDIDDILTDTSAFDSNAEYAGAIWNAATASYGTANTYGAAVEDILADTAAIDTGAEWLALLSAVDTTATAATHEEAYVTLTAGKASNDAYNGMSIAVTDADDDNTETRRIEDYTSARLVTFDRELSFTPASGDIIRIYSMPYNVTAAIAGGSANTYIVTDTGAVGGTGIEDVSVWLTADSAGARLVVSGVTDSDGEVVFYLDAGTTYYVWMAKSGYTFSDNGEAWIAE